MLDLTEGSGKIITYIYHNWRNVLDQGLYAKALGNMDDNRATLEYSKYINMVKSLIAKEQYGNNLSSQQGVVST